MNEIKVSVLCLAYNHEKFIRKCLDGFVMQKTDFKFEVLVHDDASTDGTKAIIEEYEKNYPEIIKPIYQTENQYSKGIDIGEDILLSKLKGKYIAFCESDDYWCDENKLQIQYDFMEEHSECSACFHNTIIHNLKTGEDKKINQFKEIHYLIPDDVINNYLVHTTSYFLRKEFFYKEDWQRKYWFGDLVYLTNLMKEGKLAVLPQVMSVYNYNNTGSITTKINNEFDITNRLNERRKDIEYYINYNIKTKYKYNDIIINKIIKHDFMILFEEFNYYLHKVKNKQEYVDLLKRLKTHIYFYKFKKEAKFISKFKNIIRFNSPYWFFKIWSKLKYKK